MSAALVALHEALVAAAAAVAELRREQAGAATPPAPNVLVTVAAAARLASVSGRTVRRWLDDGKLTRHGVGRSVRVDRAELLALLRDGGRRSEELSPEELAHRDHLRDLQRPPRR